MASQQHRQKFYQNDVNSMTEQLIAMKKRRKVLDDFKARALARPEKRDAPKPEAIAKAVGKTNPKVHVLTDAKAEAIPKANPKAKGVKRLIEKARLQQKEKPETKNPEERLHHLNGIMHFLAEDISNLQYYSMLLRNGMTGTFPDWQLKVWRADLVQAEKETLMQNHRPFKKVATRKVSNGKTATNLAKRIRGVADPKL